MAEAIIFKPGQPLSMNYAMADSHMSKERIAIFEDVFKSHFKNLYVYACSIIKDEETAEEIVQQVFYKLWEKKEQIEVQQSLKSYLYRAVHNECINAIRHDKVRAKYQKHVTNTGNESDEITDNASYKELQEKINTVLNELPEQCRTIFQLSRFEELDYREISEKLGVSVSTVKNQVSKALRVLRTGLADYLPIILTIVYLKNFVQ